MSLTWQTDVESDPPDAQPPPPGRNSRRGLTLLIICTLLAAALFAAWRTVRQRALQTEQRVQADVLAAHDLARQAVAGNDPELYTTLLQPEPAEWLAANRQLFENGLLFEGAARMIDLLPTSPSAISREVSLDPTLSQATVTTQHTLILSSTGRARQSLLLNQLHSYRLNAGVWRAAPPPPDFWLPEVIASSPSFTLHYPQRDQAVADLLYAELARLLPRACGLPGLTCPQGHQLTIRLTPDTAALAAASEPQAFLRHALGDGSASIVLPAPSLIGQPLDEAGRLFMARAYAQRVLAPLISGLAGYDCCERSLLARAIIQRQLYHLRLQPWPLTPDHYEALMGQGLSLGNVLILQIRDLDFLHSQSWLQMLSVVEFLEVSLPPGELLTYMESSLDFWLLRASRPEQFAVEWTEFVYERSRSAQRAADLDALPQGVLQRTCYEGETTAVQRYDLQGRGWQPAVSYAASDGRRTESIFPLPADYGNVVNEVGRDATGRRSARFVWLPPGGATTLFATHPGDGQPSLFAAYDGAAPHWRYTVLSPHYPQLLASIEEEWWQIELQTCGSAICDAEPWTVRPTWSANGADLLLEAYPTAAPGQQPYTLIRAGNRGENAVVVGQGFAPTWLDERHYAYLRPAPAHSGEEIIVASSANDRPLPIATAQDFMHLLQRDLPGGRALSFVSLQPMPTDSRLLLLHAVRPPIPEDIEPDSFLFLIHLAPDMVYTPEITLLYHSDGGLAYRPSPNGRWIAIRNANTWELLDLQSRELRPLGAVGAPTWSADGNWLAQSLAQHIMLHAPALSYSRPLVHQSGHCSASSLHWLSR